MTYLRRAFAGASIAWAALLPLAPFAASQPAPFWYGLAFAVYGAGSFICHQLPARSFHAWSAQWPVCARCTGIYFGAAATAVLAMIRLHPSPLRGDGGPGTPDPVSPTVPVTYVVSGLSRTVPARHARLLLAVAALPSAATLVYEWTTGDVPSNPVRALAGAPLGAAVAFIVVGALRVQREAGPSRVRRTVN